ncbi:MAG: copper chaperone PCu(A)C [Pseudomonadota bacterium]
MKTRAIAAQDGRGKSERRIRAWLCPGSAGLAMLLAAGVPLAATADAANALELQGAWIRAMPPGRSMTAAYGTIENKGSVDVVLTGVTSSRGNATLHESMRVDGQMRMRPIEKLNVPAGGEIRLEPGGLHVMLMGLERGPVEGEAVDLCFDNDLQELCVEAPVMRRAP